MQAFLGVNDGLGLLEPALEALIFAAQLGQFGCLGIRFAPPPPGRQTVQLAGLALAPPLAQVRGVQPFPPQEGALFTVGALFRLLQNAQLVFRREASPLWFRQHLTVGSILAGG